MTDESTTTDTVVVEPNPYVVNEREVLLEEYRTRNRQLAQSAVDSVRIIRDLTQQVQALKKLLKSKNIEIPTELNQ